ncbi:glycosyltransferase [Hyaloscypha variabilis]
MSSPLSILYELLLNMMPLPDMGDKHENPLPAYEESKTPELVHEAVEVTDDGRIGVDLNSKLARGLSVFLPNLPDYLSIVTPGEIKHVAWPIKLNIRIQVVGSRGDVQPFIALGELHKYGHRVRLATHDVFQDFVTKAGLEFFPIRGNPEELMAYMVKNPSVIPSMKSMRQGDIQRKRAMIAEMLRGFWSSYIEPDPVSQSPFITNAIIANPPSFAHTNTRAFPHPLTTLKNVGSDPSAANWISYSVVEWLTWQGLSGVINKWREDICGFFFRSAPKYTPPPDLSTFLRAGPPPVYIGFGSIVIEDPEKMSRILIDTVQQYGARAIISRAAVIHYGGAGTTACGLLNGRPTTIVPFFGDQPFWGNMVAVAGAGPKPIHHKILNAQNLAEAIAFCLTPEASAAAGKIAAQMSSETGVVQTAVDSFHSHLPLDKMACDILPHRPAVWNYSKKKRAVKLLREAAELLNEHMKIDQNKLELYEAKPIFIDPHHYDPISSTTSVFPYKEYKRRNEHRLDQSPHKSHTRSLASFNGERSGPGNVAGKVAAASGKAFGDFTLNGFKAATVDIPLACSEGLKNVPALYGDKVRDNGRVTDWKSGAIVGGKSFMYGMGEGLSDIFVQPYKGAQKEGAVGALKGVGKGTVSLVTKTTSGILGLVAYPNQGIAKSIRTAVKSSTRKKIMQARMIESVYLARSSSTRDEQLDRERVLARFEELMRSG